MSDLGEYKVFEDGGQHCVVFQRPEHQDWWQVVARFVSAERAEDYADMENQMVSDWPESPHRLDDVKAEPLTLPAPESNLPKLQFPQGVAVKGEIAKRAENVTFSEPVTVSENVPESTSTSAPEKAVNIAPEAVNSRPKSVGAPRQNKVQRRFAEHFECDPENVRGLPADHPAVVEGRTLFPSTVVDATKSPKLLIEGKNHRKIGDRVVKGPWAGMPIYCLTLEERATCPDTCHMWRECYGNGMPLARRHKANGDLRFALTTELGVLNEKHPDGFVVRLHILGDFHSEIYAQAWGDWLAMYPALRVFGYTAHPRDSAIGKIIKRMTDKNWNRFAIRFSDPEPKPQGATTIWRKDQGKVPEGIVCPAQTNDTDCCGTCGLCWSEAMRSTPIVFMAHGRATKKAGTESTKADESRKAGYAYLIGEDGLSDEQRAVWTTAAQMISETGLSPSYPEIAERAKVGTANVVNQIKRLEILGFLKRTGTRRTTMLHILKWPDHVEPRDTEGRADGYGGSNVAVPIERPQASAQIKECKPQPAPTEPVATQEPRPAQPRTSPHACATEDCRYTRQPGRAYCATCLTKRAGPSKRAHMTEGLAPNGGEYPA